MNKTKLLAVLSAIIGIIVAVVCAAIISRDNSKEKISVDLYYINHDGTGIVAEPQKLRYRNDDDLIRTILEKLRKGPSSSKLGAIMPKNTEITKIKLDGGGFLTVTFSKDFLSEDKSRNVLNVYAVVKSLCSTAHVSSVKVLVEGRPIKDRDNKPLEYISASDINLETEEYRSELKDVALYFADNDKKHLVREVRTIKITDQQPLEQYLINELIKGTDNKNMKSLLSNKTVLISADVEDNICYLNFKASFLSDNSGTDEHEKLVIYSIVNSLMELNTIQRVQFYMDGKRVEKFGSVNIRDYIGKNEAIIGKDTKGKGNEQN